MYNKVYMKMNCYYINGTWHGSGTGSLLDCHTCYQILNLGTSK